jgi:hypothetical protein
MLNSIVTSAQNDSIQEFKSPLNIPLYLAGNFGEIRGGHFHAGIDIKTQQVEGLPVLAAADGYVSRVKISLGGYGNALYITHPNGYTTAYGHLKSYNDEINQYVLGEQYSQKKFTVELFFAKDQIQIKQGDTIALSGNSGGSGGPHLHFEIRKTNGQIPQNPLKFGFDIKDNIKPTLKNLAMYPLNDTSLVNGKGKPVFIPLKKSGANYVMTKPQRLSASGVVGFGIEAIDKLNGSNNRCGVFNITLTADSSTIYEHQMDAISFENTRFINSHIDFYETKKNKRRIQKSFLTTYNKLKIYRNVQNQGKVYFSKYGHNLHYSISDANGNNSNFHFNVTVDTVSTKPAIVLDSLPEIIYTKDSDFETNNIKVHFPRWSLYENLSFQYKMGDTIKHAVSPVHHIQNLYTPLQKRITVSIKVPDVDSLHGNKLIAVSLNSKNKLISPEGGKFENGWVTFKTRSLGPYTVMIDTVAPVIKPVNFSKSSNISSLKILQLKAEDNLSGVTHYDAFIDGKWRLLQYDYKTGLIWMDLTEQPLSKGPHNLEIKIGDAVNNFKPFTFDFIW